MVLWCFFLLLTASVYACVLQFLPIKLKCFSNFIMIGSFFVAFRTNSMSLSFLGDYKRGLRGKSRFVWTASTLCIIIQGYFQFHRSGRKLPLHLIAPHLRSLICENVKHDLCVWDDQYHNWAADHFDRICHRWVHLPSVKAVLLKLQEFSRFAYLTRTMEASYRSLHDDGMMTDKFYYAIDLEMSRMNSLHPSCKSITLPAVPIPCAEPVYDHCFACGIGLSDKIDLNLVPRCECLGDDDTCLLCSSCIGGSAPSDGTEEEGKVSNPPSIFTYGQI